MGHVLLFDGSVAISISCNLFAKISAGVLDRTDTFGASNMDSDAVVVEDPSEVPVNGTSLVKMMFPFTVEVPLDVPDNPD
jgi:archaellum component FlaG (FlaF/FlaG flagellin family)